VRLRKGGVEITPHITVDATAGRRVQRQQPGTQYKLDY
jgi:hypothetical protein